MDKNLNVPGVTGKGLQSTNSREKAKLTRAITAEKIAKLDDIAKYALRCITTARQNLDMAHGLILSGRQVTPEFVQVLGNVQSATGEMLSK